MQVRTRFRPRTSGHEHGHNVSSSFRGSMMRTNPQRHLKLELRLLIDRSSPSRPSRGHALADWQGDILHVYANDVCILRGIRGAYRCSGMCRAVRLLCGTGPYDAWRDPVGVEIREMINVQQELRKSPDGRWRPENRRVQIGRCRATSAGFEYTVVFIVYRLALSPTMSLCPATATKLIFLRRSTRSLYYSIHLTVP